MRCNHADNGNHSSSVAGANAVKADIYRVLPQIEKR